MILLQSGDKQKYPRQRRVFDIVCGERGIRTPGTFYSTPDFESGTLNRSDISPDSRAAKVVNFGFKANN